MTETREHVKWFLFLIKKKMKLCPAVYWLGKFTCPCKFSTACTNRASTYFKPWDRGDINLECFNPETGTYASMACGRRFQSDIVRVKQLLLSLWSLTRRNNQTQEEMNVSWWSQKGVGISLYFSVLVNFSSVILYIMT